ncbi:MAG: MoxR family ATPase [Lachnospiraceae bacterium]|jgi:MoxR-like ATPase|nr:MoxR family ATPase [Lachnospiraceae bacterium]MCH4029046.1 MoxR family ATPase [Lachnospiraceae bacterium]MCH4066902.1 MoxR family ATPase [Lachnospiraceae bacterium]MCH4112927.1 MoxR family ATPase [Lachnospiraceae bacterium]MCI1353866.1 MoxR family ATPase [Lachnospiraceae bacterium]
MLDFLRQQGVSESILQDVEHFRNFYKLNEGMENRIPVPQYNYYGKEIWEQALSTLLAGENLLLVGPKATGKNVLAEGLSAAFRRPEWDISFYINTDAGSLIGTDTFENGKVTLRKGPILECAEQGGFGVLDEINMAKNESLAVLHATLDFRRILDVPGYSRIVLDEATRFIGTMNYGYAGTREINEALASRFMIIQMPVITEENLKKLTKDKYPDLVDDYNDQFAKLFSDIRRKCEGGEISTKALDLRGLLASIGMMKRGLPCVQALKLGIVNKCFDTYERQLVEDMITVRFPGDLGADKIFQ